MAGFQEYGDRIGISGHMYGAVVRGQRQDRMPGDRLLAGLSHLSVLGHSAVEYAEQLTQTEKNILADVATVVQHPIELYNNDPQGFYLQAGVFVAGVTATEHTGDTVLGYVAELPTFDNPLTKLRQMMIPLFHQLQPDLNFDAGRIFQSWEAQFDAVDTVTRQRTGTTPDNKWRVQFQIVESTGRQPNLIKLQINPYAEPEAVKVQRLEREAEMGARRQARLFEYLETADIEGGVDSALATFFATDEVLVGVLETMFVSDVETFVQGIDWHTRWQYKPNDVITVEADMTDRVYVFNERLDLNAADQTSRTLLLRLNRDVPRYELKVNVHDAEKEREFKRMEQRVALLAKHQIDTQIKNAEIGAWVRLDVEEFLVTIDSQNKIGHGYAYQMAQGEDPNHDALRQLAYPIYLEAMSLLVNAPADQHRRWIDLAAMIRSKQARVVTDGENVYLETEGKQGTIRELLSNNQMSVTLIKSENWKGI